MAHASVSDELVKQPGFTCFKTFAPIRYPRRWYRTALIDAALNPKILRMGPSPLPLSKLPKQAEFSFWVSDSGVSTLIVLSEAGCDITSLSAKVPTISVRRLDLEAEPTARLRREIWSHKRVPLPLEVIVVILHEVALQPRQLTLQDVRSIFGKKVDDIGPVIDAAITAGYLEVDIRQGWSPSVPVGLGPMARQLLYPAHRPINVLVPTGSQYS